MPMKRRRRFPSFNKIRYIAMRVWHANERLVGLSAQNYCVAVETLDEPLAVSHVRVFADVTSA